jgi:hypothetical protein
MKVSFSHDNAVVEDETGKGIIWANRDKDTGLYFLKPPTNVLAVMYPQHGAHSERTAFYIECMGSPTTSCLINAVERGWVNLPGLTPKLLRNHPHSIATNKGHLDKTKSGLDTTHPTTVTNHKNSAHLLVTCEQKTIFADLTGRFPHVSARGVEYNSAPGARTQTTFTLNPFDLATQKTSQRLSKEASTSSKSAASNTPKRRWITRPQTCLGKR